MNELDRPRYRLRSHRPMPMENRAAQFAAFAALSGFDEEIGEAGRLTDFRADMAEDDLAALDAALQQLLCAAAEKPLVTVGYFQRDSRKEGGTYRSYSGRFRHYDAGAGRLLFTDGTAIPVQDICAVAFA